MNRSICQPVFRAYSHTGLTGFSKERKKNCREIFACRRCKVREESNVTSMNIVSISSSTDIPPTTKSSFIYSNAMKVLAIEFGARSTELNLLVIT